MVDMQCMLMNGPNTIILGGHQQHMIEFDIPTNQIVRQVSFLINNHFFCVSNNEKFCMILSACSILSSNIVDNEMVILLNQMVNVSKFL